MTREEAISIMKVIVHMLEEKYDTDRVEEAVDMAIEALQQKPICPSEGIDCEDCPAYEDAISRKAVLDKLNRLIEVERLQGTDEMGYGRERVSAYESMIFEIESEYLYPSVSSSQKPKSEWEHDHEILKAYSDGANDMLDNIKAEIANHLKTMTICDVEKDNGVIVQSELTNRKVVLYDTVLQIIDNYKAEGSGEE